MKKLVLTTLLALTAAIGTSRANQIVVPFDTVIGTQDISAVTNPSGVNVGAVNFLFFPAVNDTATVSASGVTISNGGFGNPIDGGILELTFLAPFTPLIGGFQFDFTMTPDLPGGDPTVLFGALDNGFLFAGGTAGEGTGTVLVLSTDLTSFGPFSELAFEVIPNGVSDTFTLTSFAYDAPEPGTYVLLTSGLVLVGFSRWAKSRRRP